MMNEASVLSGTELRDLREAAGLTQRRLGEALCMSEMHVFRWERQKTLSREISDACKEVLRAMEVIAKRNPHLALVFGMDPFDPGPVYLNDIPSLETDALEIGKRIAEKRKANFLSQEHLAQRLGCHWTTVSKMERAEMEITLEWLLKIAAALRVSAKAILEPTAQ